MPLTVALSGTPGAGDWAVLGTGGVSRYVVFHGPLGGAQEEMVGRPMLNIPGRPVGVR